MALVQMSFGRLLPWKGTLPFKRGGAHYELLDENRMLAAERKLIWGDEEQAPKTVKGIAVSGGGVRSATVALGAFQVLAEKNLLGGFAYISSVSGGGYVASALSWFWSEKRLDEENQARLPGEKLQVEKSTFGFRKEDFPFQDRVGPKPPSGKDAEKQYAQGSLHEKAAMNLEFLRHQGSYLKSGDGIGVAALILAVVRTVGISLLVWLPLLIAFFLLVALTEDALIREIGVTCDQSEIPRWCEAAPWLKTHPVYYTLVFLTLCALILFVFSAVTLSLIKPGVKEPTAAKLRDRVPGATAYLLSGLLWLMVIVYLLNWQLNAIGPVTGSFVILSFLASGRLFALGAAKLSVANTSYLLRRGFDRRSDAFPIAVVGSLSVGLMPEVVKVMQSMGPTVADFEYPVIGLIGLLGGVWAALYGYYIKARSLSPGFAGNSMVIIGSILFLYGLALFSYLSAEYIFNLADEEVVVMLLLAIFMNAVVLGFLSNVNTNGLHRFYRDRLMETFMPMAASVGTGKAQQSDIADTLLIDETWNGLRGSEGQPYHIINTHAIMSKDSDPKIELRGGDNFTMSAGFVGSKATGWMRTKAYLAANGPLTLASAMAASGAAANANAGYIGTGITRTRILSIVMSLLNIRLGLWVANPRAIHGLAHVPRKFVPTYFGPVLRSGIFGLGNRSDSRYIDLSDGGHFENLGIYELVRRRVRLILALDAEQDEPINLSSLVSSANRLKEDFGAVIDFVEGKGPELLIGRESEQYPGGVKISKSPFVVGRIRYPDAPPTAIVYLKATMMPGLDFTTKGYRASNPDFPHQSTADQFFDPEQFEAYRDLGRKSCAYAINALRLTNNVNVDALLVAHGFSDALHETEPAN